jgi:hypothetical protein
MQLGSQKLPCNQSVCDTNWAVELQQMRTRFQPPIRRARLGSQRERRNVNLVLNSCASLPDLTAEQSSGFGGKSRLRYLTRKLNFSVADDTGVDGDKPVSHY